jgi:hypothetical protein
MWNAIKQLTKETRPHAIQEILESCIDKELLKIAIKDHLQKGYITKDEFNFIVVQAKVLNEVKTNPYQELWDDIEPQLFPSLAKHLESGFIYLIESYWINNDLEKVLVSEYVPVPDDVIYMYGTAYEMISPESVERKRYEVK